MWHSHDVDEDTQCRNGHHCICIDFEVHVEQSIGGQKQQTQRQYPDTENRENSTQNLYNKKMCKINLMTRTYIGC